MGVTSIILGGLAVAFSRAQATTTVFLLGYLVLGGGVVHLIETVNTSGGAGFFGHMLATILYGVAGGYILTHPGVSAVSLALLIGMLLTVGGSYQIITSAVMRYRSWGWALLQGSFSLLLAVFIYRQWPTLWVMGTFVGIDLIFRGLATFMLAMGIRAGVKPVLGHIGMSFYERRMRERRLTA
jgi:uncharacterized membrane protein HdeD (DUF308 family)